MRQQNSKRWETIKLRISLFVSKYQKIFKHEGPIGKSILILLTIALLLLIFNSFIFHFEKTYIYLFGLFIAYNIVILNWKIAKKTKSLPIFPLCAFYTAGLTFIFLFKEEIVRMVSDEGFIILAFLLLTPLVCNIIVYLIAKHPRSPFVIGWLLEAIPTRFRPRVPGIELFLPRILIFIFLMPVKLFWLIIQLLKKLLHFIFSPVVIWLITGLVFYRASLWSPDLPEYTLVVIAAYLGLLLFISSAHIASLLEKIFSWFGSVVSLILFIVLCGSVYFLNEKYGVFEFDIQILITCVVMLFVGVWGIFLTVIRFFRNPNKKLILSPRQLVALMKYKIQRIKDIPLMRIAWLVIFIQCVFIGFLMFRVSKLENQVGIKSWICNEQSSIDTTKKAIVRIAAVKGEGTGFIIHPEGVIVTNAHVIGDDISPKIIFPDYSFATARVISRYKDEDVAVLQVDKKDMPHIQLNKDAVIQSQEELFIVGYPLGTLIRGESTVTRTQFIAKRTFMDDPMTYIQMSSGIDSGFSGSPVLNACGDVVGIATNSTNASSIAIGSESVISLINPPDEFSTIGLLPESPTDFKEAFDSPAEAVLAYYDGIRARHFRLSYDLLARERIHDVPFEEFIKGYTNTMDVAVLNIEADEEKPEKVTVNLRAMDLVGQDIIPTYYEGVWTVVKEDDAWKLGSSNIKKIDEEPWWAWWDQY